MRSLTSYKPETIELYRHRVHQGALLLDKYMEGWEDKIDLGELALAHPEQCVLGQLFAKPVNIQTWQAFDYASLEEALVKWPAAIGTFKETPTREEAIRVLTAPTCDANYALGAAILNREFGTEIDRASGQDSDLMVEHGFLEPDLDEDHWSEDKRPWAPQEKVTDWGYGLLDLIWTEEIEERKALR